MVMSPYKSLFTSFSRGYVEVCVCTALPEVDEVRLLAEILYLNLSKNIFGEWFNDSSRFYCKYLPHSKSTRHISKCNCSFIFPFYSHGFLVFWWFHESFRRSIRWAVGRCNKIPSVENLKLENWLLSRTDFQDVCCCVDERKRCIEEKSLWCEHMKIKGNEWKCLGKLCFGGVGSDGKIQGGSVLSMFWWDSKPQLCLYVSASQKVSSVTTHRKRRKPRLIVAASVGLVVWVDGDFATASCFWGDAHENEVVQKNCMKFWDGRTVWQCDHAITETLVAGPLEGEGHIPRVWLDTFWQIDNKDGIIISVWTLAHEMICCLTNLIETSPCWIKLDSTIIKTSLILGAYCSEREREVIFV